MWKVLVGTLNWGVPLLKRHSACGVKDDTLPMIMEMCEKIPGNGKQQNIFSKKSEEESGTDK